MRFAEYKYLPNKIGSAAYVLYVTFTKKRPLISWIGNFCIPLTHIGLVYHMLAWISAPYSFHMAAVRVNKTRLQALSQAPAEA